MNKTFYGDITDNYVMHTGFSIAGLKNLGIQGSVLERLQTKQFVDLEKETFDSYEIKNMEDMELFIDFYIGTILNKLYTKDEIIKYIFEIELPEDFMPIAIEFNEHLPILKMKEHYFSAKVNRYNQLLIRCIGKIPPNHTKICFEITDSEQ